MAMPDRILICDDEPDLQDLLARAFERDGWTPVLASTGQEALEKLASGRLPAMILLDIHLPGVSGLDICRRIRRDPALAELPIVMLTALGDELDRVVGFEVGADDYVVKPFSVRELVLRVRALARRARPTSEIPGQIAFGALTVDPPAHRAWVRGEEIELTPIEFRLLLSFLNRKGRALRREEVLGDTWGEQHHITVRTVDTHVKRLRAKLGEAGTYLETLRGVGYRWMATPEERS
jgi:two-component system, OmpR family, phosphate regulon response regulator PhoB